MYVIYINDRPLRLLAADNAPDPRPTADPTHLRVRYSGKRKTLLHYADMLEKGSPKVTEVSITAPDAEALWEDFRTHYKWVPAAGGVVYYRDTDRVLFIFRRAYWDLPKGKIDEGEDAPTAAVREVEEETGIGALTLGKALPTTYHTYRSKREKRVLKPTYWFAMATKTEDLIPHAEEDIELAEWRTVASVLADDAPLYANLRALLERL